MSDRPTKRQRMEGKTSATQHRFSKFMTPFIKKTARHSLKVKLIDGGVFYVGPDKISDLSKIIKKMVDDLRDGDDGIIINTDTQTFAEVLVWYYTHPGKDSTIHEGMHKSDPVDPSGKLLEFSIEFQCENLKEWIFGYVSYSNKMRSDIAMYVLDNNIKKFDKIVDMHILQESIVYIRGYPIPIQARYNALDKYHYQHNSIILKLAKYATKYKNIPDVDVERWFRHAGLKMSDYYEEPQSREDSSDLDYEINESEESDESDSEEDY